MSLVILIISLALIQFTVFSFQVGMARGKYGVNAPSITGHPVFERYFRVQQNTLEQLVVFIPAMLTFSWAAENINWPGYTIASGMGVIWLIGRFIYAITYVKDPASRSLGFGMTLGPSAFLLAGTLVCILIALAG